jgi:hypothetical protein
LVGPLPGSVAGDNSARERRGERSGIVILLSFVSVDLCATGGRV